jgi:maltose O-acetyltransferase
MSSEHHSNGHLTDEQRAEIYGPPEPRPLKRWLRAVRSEMRFLAEPGEALVELAAAPLPQHSFNRVRTALFRVGGVKIGKGSQIMGHIFVTGPGRWRESFEIGDYSFITGPLRVDLAAKITIGSHVNIGHAVTLLTIDHEIGPSKHRCGPSTAGPITIENGVWIAANATILPGVTVGASSVVAAGSVVTRDVPPNALVAGVPARVIRSLPSEGLDGPPSRRTARLSSFT